MFSMAVLCMAAIVVFAAKPVDFSGTWILDESRLEDTGDMPRMDASKIIFKQDEQKLATERFVSNPMMGDFTIEATVTLDGKETEDETEFGLRKATAQWSDDQKELTINTTLLMNWDGQDVEMKIKEVLSLEKDGTVLKSVSTRNSPEGDIETTAYYNKSK